MWMNGLLLILFFFCVTVTPGLLIWAWLRWKVEPHPRHLCAHFAFGGLVLATASALLAGISLVFAQPPGGFAVANPRLLRTLGWGLFLAATGLLTGSIGAWKPGPLRWLAPACAFGVFAFWFCALSTQ